MVALPGLSTYTSEQRARARAVSPAVARYEHLLAAGAPEPFARRHTAWLECVLATYFQTASTADICAYWSQTADELLRTAWTRCGLDAHAAVLLALGKHGAEELNLSSDIDVLVVADKEAFGEVLKGVRKFQRELSDVGEWGFCYRLDFDLRPGGKRGPLVTSLSQFQDHYWSQGETWERLALVRLRPVVGATELAATIKELAGKFTYRRFLDYALLEDLKTLRAQVHQKGFERREGEIHLKLEVGGIRDIELFVHSLQVLNGGKLPEIRTRATPDALVRLKNKGLLAAADADALVAHYWFLRHVENLVQSLDDRQTHALPITLADVPALPPLKDVRARMADVDRIVSGLLGQVNLDEAHLPVSELAQRQWLETLGFKAESIEGTWPQLMKTTALSYKNDRDERARQEFLFVFVTELARFHTLDRDLGLSILLDFVRATRGKATFFSMLLRAPQLIRDLARLFCLSPYLASILAARPELLDHFILRLDEDWSEDAETLLNQMSERRLLTEIWSANQFLSDFDLNGLNQRMTETADTIAARLLTHIAGEYPASDLDIVALGKWGGRELGARSDLDFIFVTPGEPVEDDFKVARRFISRLTDPLKGGRLFDVDLRLRPSGQSGPLLVSRERLLRYWENDAKPWERQAYTRVRPVGGRLHLDTRALVARALSPVDRGELARIRRQLLRPATEQRMDLKHLPGGLIDIEFSVQTALLDRQLAPVGPSTAEMLEQLTREHPKWKHPGPRLLEIYTHLRKIEQALQLLSTHRISSFGPKTEALARAGVVLANPPEQIWSTLLKLAEDARRLLNAVDPTGLVV